MGGHPSGDPDDPGIDALDAAIERKAAALAQLGLPGTIITQVDFDVDPVLKWVEAVREHGVDLPIRVGVPGPAGVKLLLGFACRLGVGTYGDREEIRALGYQPAGQRRAGQVHSRRWPTASTPSSTAR